MEIEFLIHSDIAWSYISYIILRRPLDSQYSCEIFCFRSKIGRVGTRLKVLHNNIDHFGTILKCNFQHITKKYWASRARWYGRDRQNLPVFGSVLNTGNVSINVWWGPSICNGPVATKPPISVQWGQRPQSGSSLCREAYFQYLVHFRILVSLPYFPETVVNSISLEFKYSSQCQVFQSDY